MNASLRTPRTDPDPNLEYMPGVPGPVIQGMTSHPVKPDHMRPGDIVMSRTIGDMGWKMKIVTTGIMKTTGSEHTHDEPITKKHGELCVGNAVLPHYELVLFEDRVGEWEKGERVFSVFRWHDFLDIHKGSMFYERFQECMEVAVNITARYKMPYDVRAIDRILITKIALNTLRRKLNLRNIEHNVYCTEGCVIAYEECGVEILEKIGPQPFPSPIHMERLWHMGELVMIADYGLLNYLKGADNGNAGDPT